MKALRQVRVDVPSNVESLSPERAQFLDRLYQDSKKAMLPLSPSMGSREFQKRSLKK
jgi:hypothetical protein